MNGFFEDSIILTKNYKVKRYMPHIVEVLLKNDPVWKWIGQRSNDTFPDGHELILEESFKLTDGKKDVFIFDDEDDNELINKFTSEIDLNFTINVEAYRLHFFYLNKTVEYRKDPHKLKLGITDWIKHSTEPLLPLLSKNGKT